MSSKAEVRDTVIKQLDDDDQPREYMVVRKRHARRRRAQLQAEAPQQKFRLALLIIVVGLIVLVLTGGELRRVIGNLFRNFSGMIPTQWLHTVARPEVLVLLLAALILVYLLVPGLEPKVLALLGLQRRGRRH